MNSNLKLGDLLIVIHKEMKMKVERYFKPLGIGMGQLYILIAFYSNKRQYFSQSELAKVLDVDKGNISRSVSKLLLKNYLEISDSDSKKYKLSDQGKNLKSEVISNFISLNDEMTFSINENDLNITIRTLQKIYQNLES